MCQCEYMAKHLDDMAALFQALGDPTRLRILGLLLSGEVCVCDIHESLKIPQSKASRHLAYLRRSGLVDTRREGLWIHYRLAAADGDVLSPIAAAVRHALTHDDVVRKDGERLNARTGCCVPTPADVPSASCCSAASTLVPLTLSRKPRR
jgi:ArsR family transcriptional regulator, arsenate/arsenite/antimonite-responsive transcriptional repressor